MANDINQVVLIGRLTKDAEIKDFQNSSVARFSLAVGHRIKKDNEWKDETDFIECTYWTKNANAVRQYFVKGKQVAITGSLRQERWEKDGNKYSKLTVLALNVELLGGSGDGNKQQNTQTAPAPAPAQNYGPEDFNDADIPF